MNFKILENLFRKLDPKLQSMSEIVICSGSEEPVLQLSVGKKESNSAFALTMYLSKGEPSIHCDHSRIGEGLLIFSASCLKTKDTEFISARLNKLLEDDSIFINRS